MIEDRAREIEYIGLEYWLWVKSDSKNIILLREDRDRTRTIDENKTKMIPNKIFDTQEQFDMENYVWYKEDKNRHDEWGTKMGLSNSFLEMYYAERKRKREKVSLYNYLLKHYPSLDNINLKRGKYISN